MCVGGGVCFKSREVVSVDFTNVSNSSFDNMCMLYTPASPLNSSAENLTLDHNHTRINPTHYHHDQREGLVHHDTVQEHALTHPVALEPLADKEEVLPQGDEC